LRPEVGGVFGIRSTGKGVNMVIIVFIRLKLSEGGTKFSSSSVQGKRTERARREILKFQDRERRGERNEAKKTNARIHELFVTKEKKNETCAKKNGKAKEAENRLLFQVGEWTLRKK